MLPSRAEIEAAAAIVYASMPPTPQYRWPLLCERLGVELWVKHENHTPVGAFKLRGGLVYVDARVRSGQRGGLISATRGNHGQSIALAAGLNGVDATIVVPKGNSRSKNQAMVALGAELIEHGDDFQASREFASALAGERNLHMVPSFDPLLVTGVATGSLEFLQAVPDLDVVYVPIGMGSGICAMAAARAALGRRLRIVGVVSSQAPAYLHAFASRNPEIAEVTTQLADGLACRVTDPAALAIILGQVERIVAVDDGEVAAAMRLMFDSTHNVAEGAAAAALAAVVREAGSLRGQRVGIVHTGSNVDAPVLASVLG